MFRSAHCPPVLLPATGLFDQCQVLRMESQGELVSELKSWCRGEILDEAHAFMVLIRDDVEITQIEETLHPVNSLGPGTASGF